MISKPENMIKENNIKRHIHSHRILTQFSSLFFQEVVDHKPNETKTIYQKKRVNLSFNNAIKYYATIHLYGFLLQNKIETFTDFGHHTSIITRLESILSYGQNSVA